MDFIQGYRTNSLVRVTFMFNVFGIESVVGLSGKIFANKLAELK